MKLILTVSAECVPQETGTRDSERNLTEKGKKDVLNAAEFLNKIEISPVFLLYGPFKRTEQTGKIIAENLERSTHQETVPGLMPGADAGELIKAVTNRTECDSKEWISIIVHYSDSELILKEILGLKEMSGFPISPGLIIGIELNCSKGTFSGKILFTKYPE